jgi:hypothetical protein
MLTVLFGATGAGRSDRRQIAKIGLPPKPHRDESQADKCSVKQHVCFGLLADIEDQINQINQTLADKKSQSQVVSTLRKNQQFALSAWATSSSESLK